MFDMNNLTNEYFDTVGTEEVLEIKQLDFADKVKCFKFFFSTDHITNTSVLANMFLLINGFTDFDSNLDADPKMFFNNLEEYVDLKIEVSTELDAFCTKLIEYYFGILCGLHIKLLELKEHIPNTHFNMFLLVTPHLISKLLHKYKNNINMANVKPAHNAIELYERINNGDSIISGFIGRLLDGGLDGSSD